MRNQFLFLWIVFISSIPHTLSSQIAERLEYELSFYMSGEEYGEKIDTARLLINIDPLNFKAVDYICDYYHDRKIDSVSIFLDHLITSFPDSSSIYLFRAKNIHLEFIGRSWNDSTLMVKGLNVLEKGLERFPNDPELLFEQGTLYYDDFIRPYPKTSKHFVSFSSEDDLSALTAMSKGKQYFSDSGLKALVIFDQLQKVDTTYCEYLYLAEQQLKSFYSHSTATGIPSLNKEQDYNRLPDWYFMSLDSNWREDLSVDYLFETYFSKHSVTLLSTRTQDFKEPNLFNLSTSQDQTTFRFIYLPSFSNPFCVRVDLFPLGS